MSSLRIRHFSKEEFKEYKSWFNHAIISDNLGCIDDEWLAYVLNDQYGQEYAVFDKHQLVAVIGIVFPDSNSPFYVISNLAVNPSFQRHGIGHKALLQLIDTFQLKKGEGWKAFVEITNLPANRFFEKLGWISFYDPKNDGTMFAWIRP